MPRVVISDVRALQDAPRVDAHVPGPPPLQPAVIPGLIYVVVAYHVSNYRKE